MMVVASAGQAAPRGSEESRDACFAAATEPAARVNACTTVLEEATESREVHRALISRAMGYRRLMSQDLRGNAKRAIADLERAALLNVDKAAALYDLSMTYAQSARLVDAIRTLGDVILLDADNYDAHLNRGLFKLAVVESRSGSRMTPSQASSALADFDAAIRLRPDDAEPYRGRATARALSGDSAGAIEDYSQAIGFDPDDGEAFALRGVAWWDQGDATRALEDLTVALRFDPRNTDWLKRRGDVYLELDRFDEAMADYVQALKFKEDDPDLLKALGLAYWRKASARP